MTPVDPQRIAKVTSMRPAKSFRSLRIHRVEVGAALGLDEERCGMGFLRAVLFDLGDVIMQELTEEKDADGVTQRAELVDGIRRH